MVWIRETPFSCGNSHQLISGICCNHFLILPILHIHLVKRNKIIPPLFPWSLSLVRYIYNSKSLICFLLQFSYRKFSQSIQKKTNSVTHSRAGLRTLTFNASNIRFNSTNGSFWLGSTERPDSWKKQKELLLAIISKEIQ